MVGPHRPERSVPYEPDLAQRVVDDPAHRPPGERGVARRLGPATDEPGDVGEAGVGQPERAGGVGVVADAQVVAGAGGQRRPAEPRLVAHGPRDAHHQHADQQTRGGDAPGAVRARRRGHQHHQRGDETDRSHQPRGAERCAGGQRHHGSGRAPPPHAGEHQSGQQRSEEHVLGEGRRRVVDEVGVQRHQPRRHRSGGGRPEPAAEHADERHDRRGAGDVEGGGRPPRVVVQRRVRHEPPDGGQHRRVADRVVGRRRTGRRPVAVTGGEVLGQANVGRRVVLADVRPDRHRAPDQAHDRADDDGGHDGAGGRVGSAAGGAERADHGARRA